MDQSVNVTGDGNRVTAHNRPEPRRIGQIVTYTLNAQDAQQINGTHSMTRNEARAGDEYPAMIVRTWGGGTLAQLQVFYDGAGTHWAPSRGEGNGVGMWRA